MKFLKLLWLAGALALLVAVAFGWKNFHVETNILKLLPPAEGDGVFAPEEVNSAAMARLNRQLIWLVRDESPAAPAAPAEWWAARLRRESGLRSVAGKITKEQQRAWGDFTFAKRVLLMDAATRARLLEAPEKYAQRVMAEFLKPFAGVSANELARDPLLLVRSRQMSATAGTGGLTLADGWLTAGGAGSAASESTTGSAIWRLVRAEAETDALDVERGAGLAERLRIAEAEFNAAFPRSEILRRGALYYSDYAASQVQREMSVLGTLSLAGVALVILLFYRSALPLALSLFSTLAGYGAGVAMMFLVFGRVHFIALALTVSVVGVTVDYALHFLTERLLNGGTETPAASIRKLLPVLGLAAFTSAIAYAALLLAPFPALRQLGVCAITAVAAAFLTVVCWFPALSRRLRPRQPAGLRVCDAVLRLWSSNNLVRYGVPALFFGIGVLGYKCIKVDDDIALLQPLPAELRRQDERVAALTGMNSSQSFYVFSASDYEPVLHALEHAGDVFEKERKEGRLDSFRLLTRELPSVGQQRENIAAVVGALPVVFDALREQDLPVEGDAYEPLPAPVKPDEWLQNFVSEGWRELCFSEGAMRRVFVPVSGVADESVLLKKLRAAANCDRFKQSELSVYLVNRRAEISGVFAEHRVGIWRKLLLALLLVAITFVVWKGFLDGLCIAMPLVSGCLFAIMIPGLLGLPLNLFSMLALVLVLGIGIDYVLFFASRAVAPSAAMLSVTTAALTTLLSFGVLVFGSTPAVRGFGAVLTGGVLCCFVLAPLVHELTRKPDADAAAEAAEEEAKAAAEEGSRD